MPKRKAAAPIEPNIIAAMDGRLEPWFQGGASWDRWRVILKAAYCLPMTDAEKASFREIAEREPPTKRVRELWIIGGRRGGKDSIASLIITHAAALFDGKRRSVVGGITLPPLRRGERASILCLAMDREQARIVLDYVKSYFAGIPELKALVTRETMDGMQLANGVDVVVATNDFRSIRGRAILVGVLDECAYYPAETSSSPDTELYSALTPGMKTLPDAMLIGISTPHLRDGLLWDKFQASYGKDDQTTLVVKATSLQLNPLLSAEELEAEIAADPVRKRAEYLVEWRESASNLITGDMVDAVTMKGILVIAPENGHPYTGFVDVSGDAKDSHCLGISYKDDKGITVNVCAREIRSGAGTENVVAEFSGILKTYGLSQVYGDAYGKAWVRDAFKRYGITYLESPYDRSKIYLEFLPQITSGKVRLLNQPRLRTQLVALERHVSRGTAAHDKVDHPRSGADDLANAVAGSLVMASLHTFEIGYGKSYIGAERPWAIDYERDVINDWRNA